MLFLQGVWLLKVIVVISILTSIILLIKKTRLFNFIVILTFEVYIINLISVCFFPIFFQLPQTLNLNLIPFKSIYGILQAPFLSLIIRQLLGNIILLIPLAIFVPLLFKSLTFKKTFIICVCFSLLIELTQLTFGKYLGRTVDIDDVILNSMGIIIGLFIYKLIKNPIYKLVYVLENNAVKK